MSPRLPRILLVEDDPTLGRALQLVLSAQPMDVILVTTLEEAGHALDDGEFDVILLDLMLPDGSGLAVLEWLHARPQLDTRVLIVSALDSLGQRIEGLDLGAHGYLVKPFAIEELLARLRALLRRQSVAAAHLPRIGAVSVDAEQRRLLGNGVAVTLTSAEWAGFECLRESHGAIVSKSRLLQVLSEASSGSPSENAAEVLIHRLRGKIAPLGLAIRTERGQGYVLATD